MVTTVELVSPKLLLDPTVAHDVLQELAEMARAEWVRLAQTELKSTAQDYILGLTPIEYYGGNWAQIRLVGWLPNALEQGSPPFDMKPGLLAGPHAKISKKGVRYNIVPFRHATPGTTGRNVGAPMPITGMTKKGNPRSLVYTAAKKLAVSTESPTGKTVWGGKTGEFGGLGRRSMLPVHAWTDGKGVMLLAGRPGPYTWKHSPYAGMYKIAKTYAKATQAKYMTFRVVSDNSDPNSWWHPGFKARHFSEKVAKFIEEQSARIL